MYLTIKNNYMEGSGSATIKLCSPFQAFSETAWPIKDRFMWSLPINYKNGLGHMIKMAAMHIYSQNLNVYVTSFVPYSL